MQQTLIIRLKTLTPIWTGGVEAGKTDRLHETGIIGSLRWWYEAIVRGLGGKACDPTKPTCHYDPEKSDNGLCDVCQLFGATGWRRRFSLRIAADQTQSIWTPDNQPLNIRPPDRNRGWFLPAGRMGSLTLCFDGDAQTLATLAALLLFVERWGNLGAKPQLGYGVFMLEEQQKLAERAKAWPQMAQMDGKEQNADVPDLRHFGFFRYRFRPQQPGWWTQIPGIGRVSTQVRPVVSQHHTVPVAPALKNAWRFDRWQDAWGKPSDFFGGLHPDRVRSKVVVSWAYPQEDEWEVRGYAWLHGVKQQAVWQMFCDTAVWQQHLGQGKLSTYPDNPRQEWPIPDVQQFLETAR
jgi:CRISPR-associated protein Cmr1